MNLRSGNYRIPILSLSFKESVWQYFSVVIFTVDSFLREKKVILTTDSGKSIDLVIVRHQYNDGTYIYTATSDKTAKILNSVTNPVNGNFTVKTLLNQKLGFACNLQYDSSSTFWLLPKTRLKNVIAKLNTYTSVGNGGGSHFYVDLDGYINFVDFKRSFDHSTVQNLEVSAPNSDNGVEDWVLNTQGVIDIYSYGVSSKNETMKIKEDYGKSSIRFVDSTGNFTALIKQKLQNDFYNAFFTSRNVKVSTSLPFDPRLGTCYKINDSGDKFILTEYEFEYPLAEGGVKTFNLTLSTCPR